MKRSTLIFLGLFFFTASVGYSLSLFLAQFDAIAFICADLLLLMLTIGIFRLQEKSMQSKNPHQFVQVAMGGMILKMVVFIAAVIIYVLAKAGQYSISTVASGLLLYLVYLVAEVRMILKLNNRSHA